MEVGAERDPGRIGKARLDAAKKLTSRRERFELALVERMVGLVRAGEMAHHQNGIKRTGQRIFLCQRPGLLEREAEPVHAGVDMDRAGMGNAVGAAKTFPDRHFAARIEHRDQARFGIGLSRLAAEQPAEHEYPGVRAYLAHRAAFLRPGDEKRVAARRGKRRHRLGDSQPVSVGLDHASRTRGWRQSRQRAVIVLQRAQVDRGERAGEPRLDAGFVNAECV